MFKSIAATGRYINVQGGYSTSTYVNNSGLMGVGNLRFDTASQSLQVYDGYTWVQLNMGHAMVGLFPDAEDAITWAIEKRREELALEETAKNNPAIADLLDQRKKIDEKIKVIDILTKDSTLGTN